MRGSRWHSIDIWPALVVVLIAHAFALHWLASLRPALRVPTPPHPIQAMLLAPTSPQPPQPVIKSPEPKPVAPVPLKPVVRKVAPSPPPPPQLVAESVPMHNLVAEAPVAPSESVRAQEHPTPPQPTAEPVLAAPTPSPPVPALPAPSTPEPIKPPLFNAGYLANPAPPYPNLSRRMGEQGKVVLRVYVDTQGLAQRVELRSTSGFDRLDDVAIATVKRWKFVPARQGEKTIAAWVLIPIHFNLREGS